MEKASRAILIAALAMLPAWAAEPESFAVRHLHLRGGCSGELHVGYNGISFQGEGKHRKHSREWKYDDIQQLALSPGELRILTYEDQRWRLGRDREYRFDRLPDGLAKQVYARLRTRLDQRFVVKLPDEDLRPLWQVGAKLHRGLGGSVGTVLIGEDRVVYHTEAKDESRTWRYRDIASVSSSGPFDLTITTLEHSAWHRGSPTEYHFQLKQELGEERYNDLWRRLNRTKGLEILSSEPGVERSLRD